VFEEGADAGGGVEDGEVAEFGVEVEEYSFDLVTFHAHH